MANQTVFVLDEDHDEREALGDLLEAVGLEPRLFGSAEELLAAMDEDLPSLVIVDGPWPQGPGMALLSSLRGERRWRRVPVIVFTGWKDVNLPARRDVRVVCKPDVQELLGAIDTAIRVTYARMRPMLSRGPAYAAGPGATVGLA